MAGEDNPPIEREVDIPGRSEPIVVRQLDLPDEAGAVVWDCALVLSHFLIKQVRARGGGGAYACISAGKRRACMHAPSLHTSHKRKTPHH